jgi:hypothetical protein
MNSKARIPILLFADSVLGIQLYDWQCRILLNYEAGHQRQPRAPILQAKPRPCFPLPLSGPLQFPALPRHVPFGDAEGLSVRARYFRTALPESSFGSEMLMLVSWPMAFRRLRLATFRTSISLLLASAEALRLR